MITREEIRSIPELYKSIERDKEQLRYLREKATSVPSGITDHERVQTSPNNDAGKYSDAAADLDREIQQKLIELTELQQKVSLFIESVEDPLSRKILRYRYIKCYTWEDVADLTGYVVRWVQQIEWDIVRDL